MRKKLVNMSIIKLGQVTLYGSPKTHNPVVNNLPIFWRTLSAINTLGNNIANFLIPILKSLTDNQFTVKNSFNFVKEIKTYDSLLYMASLDVESLFTNIPLTETMNSCVSDLQNQNLYSGKLSKRDLFRLIETATSKFSFFLWLPTL